jgi:hypothetical protein
VMRVGAVARGRAAHSVKRHRHSGLRRVHER